MPNVVESFLSTLFTISSDSNFFIFQNFKFLFCYQFFPSSQSLDDMGGKIANDIPSESTQQIHSQKIMYTPMEVLYQVVKRTVKFQIWIFATLFSFLLILDHVSKSFKWYRLWKHTQDLLPKIHVRTRAGSQQNVLTELWNLKFSIFGKF